MSTDFWKQNVCWHHPSTFCLYTSSQLTHNLNFHWRWRWWDQIQATFHFFSTIRLRLLPLRCLHVLESYFNLLIYLCAWIIAWNDSLSQLRSEQAHQYCIAPMHCTILHHTSPAPPLLIKSLLLPKSILLHFYCNFCSRKNGQVCTCMLILCNNLIIQI